MGFHPDNVSNRNESEKLHMTHSLDRIKYRQCQQWKSSRGAVYDSLPEKQFTQKYQQWKSSKGTVYDSLSG
jgi:hypothetical protein